MKQQRTPKVLLLILLMSAAICSQDSYAPQMVTPEESFLKVIPPLMAKWDIPGASVALARNGRIVMSQAYGLADIAGEVPVTRDSLFRIASVSKPITSAAILKLYEMGLLDLNAKVFDILNDMRPLPGASVDPRLADITILDLLRHSGGWDRDISPDPMFQSARIAQRMDIPSPPASRDIIRAMTGVPLDFDPGSRYAYSNFGYCLLGRIIEKITGMSYEGFVTAMILSPAGATGMRQGHSLQAERGGAEVTYYDYPGAPLVRNIFPDGPEMVPAPYGSFAIEPCDAAGGWLASATDLLRFLLSIDKNAATPDILEEATIRLMTSRPPLPEYQQSTSYYALGWQIRSIGDDAEWSHTGGLPGAASLMVRMPSIHGKWRQPSEEISYVVLFNSQPADTSFYTELEAAMHRAVKNISYWPSDAPGSTLQNSLPLMTRYRNPQRIFDNPIESSPQSPLAAAETTDAERSSLVEPEKMSASLQDAMLRMTLSVISLSDSQGERFVFVNGRKYFEGSIVEGNYFLEHVTLQGALLRYQGEQAVLRLDPR